MALKEEIVEQTYADLRRHIATEAQGNAIKGALHKAALRGWKNGWNDGLKEAAENAGTQAIAKRKNDELAFGSS